MEPIDARVVFVGWDRALIMYLLRCLLVTKYGPKAWVDGVIVCDREAYLRGRMHRAKKMINRAIYARTHGVVGMVLPPETYQCVWLRRLSETCRFWYDYVKVFRQVGAMLLYDSPERMDLCLRMEQKFHTREEIRRVREHAKDIVIKAAKALTPDADELKWISNKHSRTSWYRQVDDTRDGWSIMEVKNSHKGKIGMTALAKHIRMNIDDVVSDQVRFQLDVSFDVVCLECGMTMREDEEMCHVAMSAQEIKATPWRKKACVFKLQFYNKSYDDEY